jgi:DNA-binding response OmpR family regulator
VTDRLVLVHDGLEADAPRILTALKDAGLRVMLISREDLAIVAPADVVLLRLVDRDPVAACWRIHRQGHQWIVALATDPSPDECIRILNAGADGYMSATPGPELIARVRSLLRLRHWPVPVRTAQAS